MRKIFCVLVLVCAGAGMIVAQEEEAAEPVEAAAPGVKTNAVTMDTIPLFNGIITSDSDADTLFFCMAFAYERLIAPHFTIGAEVDLYPGKVFDTDYLYYSMAAAGRYYPMSEYMEKFFIGANLGFNVQAIDGKTKAEYGGFTGLLIGLRAGYKLHFTDMFYVEPSMSYTYSKSGISLFGSFDSSNDSSDSSDAYEMPDIPGLFGGMTTPQNNGWGAGLRIGISF
jgi:hypothetical protein